MNHVIPSRRSLLAGLGLGATATLFPSLRPKAAWGAVPSGIPKRIVFFWTGNGSLRPLALPMAPPTMAAATKENWVLPELLSPLKAYKEKLVMIENLDMISAQLDPMDASNAHEWGNVHSLTGTNMATGSSAGGISIDQYIANGLKNQGVITAVPSIGMAWSVNKPCYSGRAQQIPMPASAKDWYKRLFPNGAPKPPSGGVAGPDPAAVKSAAQQKSILDAVNAELKSLAGRMSTQDKIKLDAHAQSVADLSKRIGVLQGGGSGSVGPGATCQPLVKSNIDALPNADGGSSGTAYSLNIDAQLRTIQAAFSCDLTRVATIVMDTPPGDQFGYNNGSWGTSDSHDLLHKTADLVAGGGASLTTNPDAAACIKRLYQRHYEDLAKLLGYLAAVPESDGSSLLDHTVVVYCSQIASGGHDLRRLPWFTAGGGAGMVKPNRYLKLPRKSPGIEQDKDQGVPHNNLFVSLANMMDVPTTTFGNPAACTGPLEGL